MADTANFEQQVITDTEEIFSRIQSALQQADPDIIIVSA